MQFVSKSSFVNSEKVITWCWVGLIVLTNIGKVLTQLEIDPEIMGTAEVKYIKTKKTK